MLEVSDAGRFDRSNLLELEVGADADEETCRNLALSSEKARRAIDGRELVQVIVREPRLVNLVTSR